jgi:recombinational DNA repair protein (RecF pathway)
MTKQNTTHEKLQKCANCHQDLTSFMAYIPGIGEVCMKCYVEYAKNDENNTK